MKKFLCLWMLVSGLSRQLVAADTISVEDISLIQGTPVAGENWHITDYQEDEQGLAWLWLENALDYAIVLFPRAESSDVNSPWGESFLAHGQQITLAIQAATSKAFETTRFGGKLIATGHHLILQYEASASATIEANFYDLISSKELLVSGKHHATLIASSGITKIIGTDSDTDELYAPNADSTWQLSRAGGGSIKADTWSDSVQFAGMEALIGSEFKDEFVYLDGTINSNIHLDGAGGGDTLILANNSNSGGATQQTWAITTGCSNGSSSTLNLASTQYGYQSNSVCDLDINTLNSSATFTAIDFSLAKTNTDGNVKKHESVKSKHYKSGVFPGSLIAIILCLIYLTRGFRHHITTDPSAKKPSSQLL